MPFFLFFLPPQGFTFQVEFWPHGGGHPAASRIDPQFQLGLKIRSLFPLPCFSPLFCTFPLLQGSCHDGKLLLITDFVSVSGDLFAVLPGFVFEKLLVAAEQTWKSPKDLKNESFGLAQLEACPRSRPGSSPRAGDPGVECQHGGRAMAPFQLSWMRPQDEGPSAVQFTGKSPRRRTPRRSLLQHHTAGQLPE